MGQYCFARCRLSSVTLRVDGRRAGNWARGRSSSRDCTAGQYGYVPLGRHLVLLRNTARRFSFRHSPDLLESLSVIFRACVSES